MNDLIKVKNGDVISIVGSGGKTSLMYFISKKIKQKKVLVSTTTKIRIPDSDFYDYIAFDIENAKRIKEKDDKGIYVFANKINDNKLSSFELEELKDLSKGFDNVVLEADGSKEKLIKAWNDNEPVILEGTTKTVGVLNLDILGKKVNEENIHRLDKFIDITSALNGEEINEYDLIKLVINKNGLFKNALGQKILFINAVENSDKKRAAKFIADYLIESNYKLDYIVFGSIVEGEFELYDKC